MKLVTETINKYLRPPTKEESLNKLKNSDMEPKEILDISIEYSFLPGIKYALENGATLDDAIIQDIYHIDDIIEPIQIVNRILKTNFETRKYSGSKVHVINVKGRGIPDREEILEILVDKGYDEDEVSTFLENKLTDIFVEEISMIADDIEHQIGDFVIVGRSGGWWGTTKDPIDFMEYDFDQMREDIFEREPLSKSEMTGDIKSILPRSIDKYIILDDEGRDYFKRLFDIIEETVNAYSNQEVWATIVEGAYND